MDPAGSLRILFPIKKVAHHRADAGNISPVHPHACGEGNLHLSKVLRIRFLAAFLFDLREKLCARRFHFEQMPSFRSFWNAESRAVSVALKMPVAGDDFKLIAVCADFVDFAADAAKLLDEGRLFAMAAIK